MDVTSNEVTVPRPDRWRDVDLDAALALLRSWRGRDVVVSVELAGGPAGLAGMAGVLRAVETGDGAEGFELEGSQAWFSVPAGECFRGATYVADRGVLVLQLGGDGDGDVLIDVQLCAPVTTCGA